MEVETESPDLLLTWTGRDGILILDAESGCVLEVNPFLTELLGFAREELRGRRIVELGVFWDRAQVEALFEKVRREGYAHCDELPLRTGEGDKILVEFVGNSYLVDKTLVIQFNVCERS
jgi:PAS domain S-box-containing protein